MVRGRTKMIKSFSVENQILMGVSSAIFFDIVTPSFQKWLLRFQQKWISQIYHSTSWNLEKFVKSNFSAIKFTAIKVYWPGTLGLAVIKLEDILLSYQLNFPWSLSFPLPRQKWYASHSINCNSASNATFASLHFRACMGCYGYSLGCQWQTH